MPRSLSIHYAIGTSLLSAAVLVGCDGGRPAAPAKTATPSKSTSKAKPEAVHEHPEEGPHHGELVELGNEEYHAEIVHGEGGEITVYLLDDHAKEAVAIDSSEIVINLSHDGKAEQFKLAASAQATDPAGQSSRFVLKDEELAEDLDSDGTAAKLVVTINGKSYTGKIEHHHEDGADHDHNKKKK